MANTSIGSFVINDLVAIGAHGAGSLAFGPIAIPAGFTQMYVAFDLRQVVSLTAVLGSTLELSFDGGQNWAAWGGNQLSLPNSGYVLNGGVLSLPASDFESPLAPVRVFASRTRLPKSHLTTRQVRGTLSSSEALISGVTLSAF